ncbi:tumor necrosis factor receptor superfamily member 5 [Podarcis raffonei]|uniref:tumor necrosis factor receptor superfamily member 5 n=1 Tax=Podarcis raffonei TaxID=65483 RepID=UPI002329313B|nr:tumor necrosis factor receptor superfamily member 5 [Podarcis raffonei]
MRWRLVPWTAVWGGCAFLALCLALELRSPSCSVTEYLEGGRCCQKCGPGTKVQALCSESSETRCVACEAQHFQAGWTKEKHCAPQAYCDENAGFLVFMEGDTTRNVVCRCRTGTHCSSRECLTCRVNRECPAGEGVQRQANHLNDTVCVACPPGSFSNISSATARCQPWSSCEAGKMVRLANGTHSSDVVCGVLPTQPPQEEARRSHVLLVVPLVAILGLLAGALFLLRRHRRRQDLPKPPLNQPEAPVRPQPEEVEEPALPVQETLLGGQPVAQEDGKESRLAEQEQNRAPASVISAPHRRTLPTPPAGSGCFPAGFIGSPRALLAHLEQDVSEEERPTIPARGKPSGSGTVPGAREAVPRLEAAAVSLPAKPGEGGAFSAGAWMLQPRLASPAAAAAEPAAFAALRRDKSSIVGRGCRESPAAAHGGGDSIAGIISYSMCRRRGSFFAYWLSSVYL